MGPQGCKAVRPRSHGGPTDGKAGRPPGDGEPLRGWPFHFGQVGGQVGKKGAAGPRDKTETKTETKPRKESNFFQSIFHPKREGGFLYNILNYLGFNNIKLYKYSLFFEFINISKN